MIRMARNKRMFPIVAGACVVFLTGFAFTSGSFGVLCGRIHDKIVVVGNEYINRHICALATYHSARHYFLLSPDDYARFPYEGCSAGSIVATAATALFNALFQPLCFCPFTYQTFLIFLLFPFFVYGAFRHARQIWFPIVIFGAFLTYIGMKNAIVEPLVRHRLTCELFYYMIAIAGFVDVTARGSSSS